MMSFYPKMTSKDRESQWFSLPLIVLPSIHFSLIVLTILLSLKTAGGAVYRVFGVDPLAAVFMMADEGIALPVVGALLIFGTAWWYFIGRIGWASNRGKLSRVGSALGAILALFFSVVGFLVGRQTFNSDFNNGQLSAGAFIQYLCVAAILIGGFISAIYSIRATFRRESGSQHALLR